MSICDSCAFRDPPGGVEFYAGRELCQACKRQLAYGEEKMIPYAINTILKAIAKTRGESE
jgi:hypothetical protein